MIAEGDWPRRGEIWWAHSPGQPEDPHQPRPVVVMSVDQRNSRTDDVIVVPIFSAGRPGPNRVRLPGGIGGLRHDSIAFCDEITTITHQFLEDRPMGTPVPENILDQLVAAIISSVSP